MSRPDRSQMFDIKGQLKSSLNDLGLTLSSVEGLVRADYTGDYKPLAEHILHVAAQLANCLAAMDEEKPDPLWQKLLKKPLDTCTMCGKPWCDPANHK